MNPQDTTRPWTPLGLFAFIFLGCAVVSLLMTIVLDISGRGNLGNDAHLTEYNICLDDESFRPVNMIPLQTKAIYLCGIIEGKGFLRGVWHLYLDQQVIDSHYFERSPGVFFEQISLGNELSVGSYRIDFFSKKQVRAEVEFTVTSEPLSN